MTNVAGMAGIIPAYLLDDLIRQDVIPAVDQSEISGGQVGRWSERTGGRACGGGAVTANGVGAAG